MSTEIYKVWNYNDEDEAEAEEIEARSAGDAAELFAEGLDGDALTGGEIELSVRDPAGNLFDATVEVSWEPVFRCVVVTPGQSS